MAWPPFQAWESYRAGTDENTFAHVVSQRVIFVKITSQSHILSSFAVGLGLLKTEVKEVLPLEAAHCWSVKAETRRNWTRRIRIIVATDAIRKLHPPPFWPFSDLTELTTLMPRNNTHVQLR